MDAEILSKIPLMSGVITDGKFIYAVRKISQHIQRHEIQHLDVSYFFQNLPIMDVAFKVNEDDIMNEEVSIVYKWIMPNNVVSMRTVTIDVDQITDVPIVMGLYVGHMDLKYFGVWNNAELGRERFFVTFLKET